MTLPIVIGSALFLVFGLLALSRYFQRFTLASSRTLRLRSAQTPSPPADLWAEPPQVLSSILTLSAYLLESHDERSVLRAVMNVGCEMLDAEGSLFVPFGEFLQTLPAMEFGRTPDFASFNYDDRLTNPAIRQKCKTCIVRRGGPDCILLRQEKVAEYFNYCVPLLQNGREAGLFSFVFHASPQVDAQRKRFLDESLRLVELALDAFQMRMQAMAFPTHLPVGFQSPAPEVEARAILGERMRLACEIHDGLAQTLAFLKIEIGRVEKLLEQGKSKQAASILHDSSLTLSDAYLDARQAIENLRCGPDGRLETWLGQVVEDFETLSGLRVELKLSNLPALPINVQAQMIRIVQEALTNARKHSLASLVKLSAWEQDGEVRLEVRDNGQGFALSNIIAAARFGLRGMRERAETIGADFQVASSPGEGVTIHLRVPIRDAAQA